MWEHGLPKVLTWRWSPFAALTLGAASFAAFALLVIPEQIGEPGAATHDAAARFKLGDNLASTQAATGSTTPWSGSGHTPTVSPAPTVAHVAAARPAEFPKRGFSPPLERPDPPPQPVPAPALTLQAPPPGQPAGENLPPPVPEPPLGVREEVPQGREAEAAAQNVAPPAEAPAPAPN